ncbi:ATP-dependent nuclease [Rhizobium sp. PAMB 3182]
MLKKIRIRNFRSISDLTLDLDDLNILIGKNDTGKSNILRALNLFFNGETDFRKEFDFKRDFAKHAKTGQGKAPEVRIDVQFNIPKNYQVPDGARAIEWTCRWRSNEDIEEEPVFIVGSNKKISISRRSKIRSYLNNIDYHYIPALKGREYFSELLADIYDVLSDVAEDDLLLASQPLQKQVEVTLEDVAKELEGVLQNASLPKLPDNLGSIFRLIQFESEGIDLDRRGDGIRVRHVPSLMTFLCDLKSKRAGHFQSGHIWGFEEPENSVDFISAFALRDQILDISRRKDFQILMSTHSPVFFKLEEADVAKTMFFTKANSETRLSSVEGDVSDEMGVLRVVSPYVEKSRAYVDELRVKVANLTNRLANDVLDPSQKVVFLEGDSDVLILKAVCDKLNVLQDVRFICSIADGYSSANAVADNLIAWHHVQKSRELNRRTIGVGLVDDDAAGEKAKEIFNEKMRAEKSKNARIMSYQVTSAIAKRTIAAGFKPKMTVESFAPADCWKVAFDNKWLQEKSRDVVLASAVGEHRRIFLDEGLKALYTGAPVDLYPHLYDVKIERKRDFSEIFCQHIEKDAGVSAGFSATIKAVRDAFLGTLV